MGQLMQIADEMIQNKKIQEMSKKLISDACQAILGNPIAWARLVHTLRKLPQSLHDEIFWTKFKLFLDGTIRNELEWKEFSQMIDNSEANAFRLINYIDKAESCKKIKYFSRVTRSLIEEKIDKKTFFRVFNIITQVLEEDLDFLLQNYKVKKFEYNNNIQGLLNVGLVYQSVVDGGNSNGKSQHQYSFTPLFKDVFLAITGKTIDIQNNLKTSVNLPVATNADIDSMFNF